MSEHTLDFSKVDPRNNGTAVLILRTDDDWVCVVPFTQSLLDSQHFVSYLSGEALPQMQSAYKKREIKEHEVRDA